RLGRVLRSNTASFGVGCQALGPEQPRFGALVRALGSHGGAIYGLIYDVRVEDDPFVRQLVAAGDVQEEYIEDHRRRRQVPVEVSVLVVGGRDARGRVFYHLPPQPPATLSWVEVCPSPEVREFGRRLDFLRTVLNAADAPGDELAAAALRSIAEAQDNPAEARQVLVAAGRELARLLARDPLRLNSILQRLR
ncbi:MAG: hypothetical protein NZ528_00560, partial [Caldilineales bacterium]|nr:hypothetical protein [Caldilineales bacterium]